MIKYLSISLIATLAAGGSLAAAPASVSKPNILFIIVDDLGKDWVSCYGADDIKTPHTDALAQGGMKFQNAYSMGSCSPSRATLLTGKYPFRTGWVSHWDVPRWGVGYFDSKKKEALQQNLWVNFGSGRSPSV